MSRTAVFIDAAYYHYMLRDEFSSARTDCNLLVQKMANGIELLRGYYYDCLPYQSNPPTEDEKQRFGKKQSYLAALEKNQRFQVRLGRLEYRGKDHLGKPQFEQKKVDILLAVDLVSLAAKHQITDAAIMAGDSDFMPAIEIAKQEGVAVRLYHGKYPHRDLVQTCDERTQIDKAFVDSILMKK